MSKRIAPLSDIQVKSVKPSTGETKLFDGGGLFLLISPTGDKLWRSKYRFGGREKLLALGAYPPNSLAEARQRREDAKKLLALHANLHMLSKMQTAEHITALLFCQTAGK